MTLPTSDAHSSRYPFYHPEATFPTPAPTHSMTPPLIPIQPTTPSPDLSNFGPSWDMDYERTIDFATHTWDLATGGLKTLTAKREFPSLYERRPTEKLPPPNTSGVPRSYAFLLIVLVCLVLMLISGGVVLFVMLQP